MPGSGGESQCWRLGPGALPPEIGDGGQGSGKVPGGAGAGLGPWGSPRSGRECHGAQHAKHLRFTLPDVRTADAGINLVPVLPVRAGDGDLDRSVGMQAAAGGPWWGSHLHAGGPAANGGRGAGPRNRWRIRRQGAARRPENEDAAGRQRLQRKPAGFAGRRTDARRVQPRGAEIGQHGREAGSQSIAGELPADRMPEGETSGQASGGRGPEHRRDGEWRSRRGTCRRG